MRPVAAGLANEVHDALGAISKPDSDATGWALLQLLDALLTPLQPVEDVVRDTDEGVGWSGVLDVDRCPVWALRWLGQLAGVRVTKGDETDPAWATRARAEIRNAAGFKRGTPASIVAAAQSTLTGTKSVRLLERDTSPYHLTVIVRPGEVPPSDVGVPWNTEPGTWNAATGSWDGTLTTKVRDAVMAQKPAGLVLTFLISDSALVDEGTKTIDSVTVATVDNATLADVAT